MTRTCKMVSIVKKNNKETQHEILTKSEETHIDYNITNVSLLNERNGGSHAYAQGDIVYSLSKVISQPHASVKFNYLLLKK